MGGFFSLHPIISLFIFVGVGGAITSIILGDDENLYKSSLI